MCMLRAAGLLYSLLQTPQTPPLLAEAEARSEEEEEAVAGLSLAWRLVVVVVVRSSGSLCSAARAGDQMLRLGEIVLLYRK